MPAYTKVSGTWRQISRIFTKVSGTWQEADIGYTKVSGAWKVFYSASISPLMTRGSGLVGGSIPVSGYSLNNGGSFDGPFGSLGSPNTYKGSVVEEIFTRSDTIDDHLTVVMTGGSLGQDFFTSIECSLGTYNTASADEYNPSVYGGGYTWWRWYNTGWFASSGTETVTIS